MPDDEKLTIDHALDILKTIQREYRNEPVAHWAALMSEQIRPTMAVDSTVEERQRIYKRTPKEFTEAAAKARPKRRPGYKTAVFKCVEDFENCKMRSSETLCRAALAICIGKHLIPFVPSK
jgi:hypothetical protein